MDGRMDGRTGGWMDGWMGGWVGGWMDGWMDGWLENEFLKKTPSPKSGLESQLGTSDFGVCQKYESVRSYSGRFTAS